MSSSVNSNIIGAAEREFAKKTATGGSELDKMAFLKLLVAQLQNQDPLDPMDDTAFVAQLAQFTQLETLNNISSSMDSVIEGMGRQENLGAANFLGKHVESYGDQISMSSTGQTTELYYYLNEDLVAGQVNIMNGETGEVIRTLTMGAKNAGGPYPLEWDGLDYKGKRAPEGVYLIGMSGFNAEGGNVIFASQVSGKVDRVFYEEGLQYLGLEDGRVINLSYVTAIRSEDAPETLQEKIDRLEKEIKAYDDAVKVLDQEITDAQAIINNPDSTEAEKTAATANLKSAEAKKLIAAEEKAEKEAEKTEAEEDLAKENEKKN